MSLLGKTIEHKIEDELKNYPSNARQYVENMADVLHGNQRPYSNEGRSMGHISDTTLAKVQRRATLAEDERAKWVLVVNRALKGMGQELQMLVKYMYFEQMRYIKVADRLHISVSLVYAWRERVLLEIGFWATQEGLIRPMREER